jgi:hypothetical protein
MILFRPHQMQPKLNGTEPCELGPEFAFSLEQKKVMCDTSKYLRDNPARLSIKDFKWLGLRLVNDVTVSDGDIFSFDVGLDSFKEYDCSDKPPSEYEDFFTVKKVTVPGSANKCRYMVKQPVIELHAKKSLASEPSIISTLIYTDASTLTLRSSSLELCGSRLAKVKDGGDAEYGFVSVNGAAMHMAWDQSPFFTGCGPGEAKTLDLVGKHVQTFASLFYPQASVTGQEGLCPLNYVKSGDLCYGQLGYFYHYPLRHPLLASYLGVLPQESRLDVLPAAPMVSSATLPAVVAGASKTVSVL